MKIVQQTIASLGSPMWIVPLGMPYRSAPVIARWRHLNGRLQIATADAIRVCLILSTGQQVRHDERDRSLAKSVLAGDVIVLRSGIPTETTLAGDAEVVQIFIEPESLGLVANNTVTGAPVAPPGDSLPSRCSAAATTYITTRLNSPSSTTERPQHSPVDSSVCS